MTILYGLFVFIIVHQTILLFGLVYFSRYENVRSDLMKVKHTWRSYKYFLLAVGGLLAYTGEWYVLGLVLLLGIAIIVAEQKRITFKSEDR